MSKIATDLEQSKKLAEILPIESADMMWLIISDNPRLHVLHGETINSYSHWNNCPAWSLSALLEAMPAELIDNHYLTLDKESYTLYDEYCCCYEDCNGISTHDFFGKNPIDAVFGMILWLKENNKIMKEEKTSGRIDNLSAISVSGNGKGNTSVTKLSKEEAEAKVWYQS